MTTPSEHAIRRTGAFAFCSILAVAMLWLPFGFGMVGHIEEWDLLSLFTQHGTFFFAGADSPLASHRLRPLTALPNAAAYSLGPDSFVAMHVLQMAALSLKGIASACIAWWLFGSRRWAAMAAILAIFYPADTMQLSFRSFHINWSVALALLGVCLVTCAYDRERRPLGRAAQALVAGASFAVAVQIYEVALAYAIVPLLLLWCRHGLRASLKLLLERLGVSLVWVATILACLAYIYYVLVHGSTYQSAILSGQATTASVLIERVERLLDVGVARALFGGWIDAASITAIEFKNYWFLAAATAVLTTMVLWMGRRSDGPPASRSPIPLSRIAAFSATFLILGYLPFVASASHLVITQRTYLFAAPGAALLLVVGLSAIARISRAMSYALAATLIALALASQMHQFHHYQQISDEERLVLSSVIKSVPDLPEGKHLIILDGSQRLNNVWMLRDNIDRALTYLYGHPVGPVQICTTPGNFWQHVGDLERPGRCIESPDMWTFASAPGVSGPGFERHESEVLLSVPKADTIVMTIDANDVASSSIAAANRKAWLATSDDTVARRFRGVLGESHWPLRFNQFRSQETAADYRWDFGRWWNLDVPTRGIGWGPVVWETIGRFEHASFVWSNNPQATVIFSLSPDRVSYLLKGHFKHYSGAGRRERIAVKVNGRPVDIHWNTENEFEGIVGAGVLVKGSNVVEFDIPTDDEFYGYGAYMDWFRLSPN